MPSGMFWALLFCAPFQLVSQTSGPVYPGAEWEVSTPEAEGMDPARFATAMDALPDLAVVIRHGKIIGVKGDIARPGPLFSASKALLSVLFGMLMQRGLLTLDEPVPGSDQPGPPLATFRQFLSMTSDFRLTPHEPGQHYAYSNSGAIHVGNYMFGRFYPGQPETQALREAYLDKLGIQDSLTMIGSVSGWGGGGFVMSTRDFARVGYLILRNGNWKGEQLLPPDYVASLYVNQIPLTLTEGGTGSGEVDNQTGVSPRLPGSFSFFFWLPAGRAPYAGSNSKTVAATASGSHGTTMHIVPKYDLILCGVNTAGASVTGGKIPGAVIDMFGDAVVTNTPPPSPGGDTAPPSAPSDLTATIQGASVVLSWNAATDNVGVAGYRVLRDGAVLASLAASARSFTDASASAGSHSYAVEAFDAAGNSARSTPVTITAPGGACELTLGFPPAMGAGGGSFTAEVTTGAGCSWKASVTQPWVSFSVPSGNGTGTYTAQVAAAADSNPRIGAITVDGKEVHVIQRGAGAAAPYSDVALTDLYADYIALIKLHAISAGCNGDPTLFCPNAGVARAHMAAFVIRALLGENFPFPATPKFSDVPATDRFFKYIQKVAELGIDSGCGGGRFCPGDAVPRWMAAQFLIRAKAGPSFAFSAAPAFADVPPAAPYFAYVQKVRDLGISKGCSPGNFCPDAPLTRSQMALFVARALLSH